MSGWRDSDGRTAVDRRKRRSAQERANLIDTLRKPHTWLKPTLGAFIALVLAAALLLAIR